jgi:hypothetical protein
MAVIERQPPVGLRLHRVLTYLTDLAYGLWSAVTGRLFLLARCLAFLGVFSLSPLFGAPINLGFRDVDHFLGHASKPFGSFFTFPQFEFFRHDLLNFDGFITDNQIGITVRVVFPTKAQVMQAPSVVGVTRSRMDKQTSFGRVLVEGLDLLLGKIKGGVGSSTELLSGVDFAGSMFTRFVLESFNTHVVGVVECNVPKIKFCLLRGVDIFKLKIESWWFSSCKRFQQPTKSRDNIWRVWPFFRWTAQGFDAEMAEIDNGQCNSREWKIQNPIFVREIIEKSTQQKRDNGKEDDSCRHANNWSPWLPFSLALGFAAGFIYALFLFRRIKH